MRFAGRRSRLSVLAPCLLTVALFCALAGSAILVTLTPEFAMDPETAAFLTLVSVWALVQSGVGTASAWRRPENRIGRLMQATGPLIITVFAGFLVGALRYLGHGPGDTIGALAAWLGSTAIYPMIFLALPMLGILFPDGRLPAPAFRRPVAAVASVVASPALAVAGVAVRWRRGMLQERAQLKWLLAALSLAALTFGPSWGSSDSDAFDLLSILSGLLVPLAIGIAVLRYRLYEIDRLISRTLSWAVVTAILTAAFAAGVWLRTAGDERGR